VRTGLRDPCEEPCRRNAINSADITTVRLAHFSDIHVSAAGCVWRREDWFNKRLTSWFNLRLLGRGFRFRQTDRVLAALSSDLHTRGFDRVVFSGDATALGFEAEVARAAELLGLREDPPLPGLAVPGNHDYCTLTAATSGCFERYFRPWLSGERIDEAVYPFAQRVGPAWLVAVNSATPNRWAWDASGAVGGPQLQRLERLLEGLSGGPRILVTHYPINRAGGKPERGVRDLRDLDAVLEVARRGGISLWLHGHNHDPYQHAPSELIPFPVLCAGSTTQQGKWSYGEYTLRCYHLAVLRRVYDEREGRFRDAEAFEMQLPERKVARKVGTV
jgi:3',5'-cyclic AMP phosphodiesterase CpdA